MQSQKPDKYLYGKYQDHVSFIDKWEQRRSNLILGNTKSCNPVTKDRLQTLYVQTEHKLHLCIMLRVILFSTKSLNKKNIVNFVQKSIINSS